MKKKKQEWRPSPTDWNRLNDNRHFRIESL